MSNESIETNTKSQEVTLELEVIITAFKQFNAADLFKVIRVATTEAEKRSKSEAKGPKKEKGPTPKQLRKPGAWVKFVLNWARSNGWKEFTCFNKKSSEEIVMPASVIIDDMHVFPSGKNLILTQAMSLSKQLWQPKLQTGSNEELYHTFEAEFAAFNDKSDEDNTLSTSKEKPVMIRKTADEKEKEIAMKKAELERAKAEKKAAKEAEKASKASEKASKASEKASKASEKATTSVKTVSTGIKPGKKNANKVEEWTCPTDGNVYPWFYKKKNYLRNSENQIWEAEADGSCGDWAGVFLPTEDRIDESAVDPFSDSEEDED